MSEPRIIDAEQAKALLSEWDWQDVYLPVHFKELILDETPTVDPETLPIVKELREKIKKLNQAIENLSQNIKYAYQDRDEQREKLARYEQAEKEGRLIEPPCKVGGTVYYLTGNPSLSAKLAFNRVEQDRVDGFYFDERGLQVRLHFFSGNHGTYGFFGKTVFLTREEAENALKEREEQC